MKNTNNLAIKLLKRTLLLVVLILSVSACNQLFSMKVVKYADRGSYQANPQTLETVDRTFYAALQLGDWRYQGSNAFLGEVRAFIQIPKQLDLTQEVQKQYLQQMLCPSADNQTLWSQLKNIDLEIHIYTNNRNKSVFATCINPLNKMSTTAV